MMGLNCLKARAASRRQLNFYHWVPGNSWYSFYQPRKNERLSRTCSHPVVLNTGIQHLNHRSTSRVKLLVYKTVTCEVITGEFLSRDLHLNNFVIMIIWKRLKLLHSSKEMRRIDSHLKKLTRLKYLILETPYTFFSIFSCYFIVLNTLPITYVFRY